MWNRSLLSVGNVCLMAAICQLSMSSAKGADPAKPNIIFILADDLGYGDLGCYGQKLIKTPALDRMANEGIRFTQFYAGSTVCAPSRSVLMTGLHTGHTRVRGNAGLQNHLPQTLREADLTVARLLQKSGYATGLVGKWGLGRAGDSGHPNRQGFDEFFGYLSQHHAHNHFPDHLWRNETKVALENDLMPIGPDGAGYSTNRKQYSSDLFAQTAIEFVESHKDRPFFLFYAMVVPHANNERTQKLGDGLEVPDYGIYADEPWAAPLKGQAAMISRMDQHVGQLIEKLKSLGIDDKTIVMFSSDNGPHREGGQDALFFDPNGPLKGYKRDLFEGGIRVPLIVRWPGTIQPGVVSPHVGYFGDIFATAAELASVPVPPGLDSHSLVPTLTGKEDNQQKWPHLYWEFHERGFSQAVLMDGRYKAIRLKNRKEPIQIYDLQEDLEETSDLASSRKELVARATKLFETEHLVSPDWPITDPKPMTTPKKSAEAPAAPR